MSKPILIHLHIYYQHLWPELRECLLNITNHQYQLYVTMIEAHEDIIKDIQNTFKNHYIEIVDNCGYDIGPFIHILNKVNLDDYSYIIKLHTKRDCNGKSSNYTINGICVGQDIWRKLLLYPFSSIENFNNSLELLSNKDVGMIGTSTLIVDKTNPDYISLFEEQVKSLITKLRLTYRDFSFIAGTMFIAKAYLFKILQRQNFLLFNPSVSVNKNFNDIVYVVERFLGAIIIAQGLKIVGLKLKDDNEDSLLKTIQEKKSKRKFFGFVKTNCNGNKKTKFYLFGLCIFKKEKTAFKKKIYFLKCQIYHKRINPICSTSTKRFIQTYSDWLYDLKNNKALFVPLTKQPYQRQKNDIKIFAYYLPQFHAIPENDDAHGKGFTEWTNVASASPMYVGHYQPKIPYDVGFYNLNDIKIIQRQVELAKTYGIYGFCFYYYWFNGKKLLEKPIDLFLNSDIDFSFHFCWANENWSKLWDGGNKQVILRQEKTLNANLFFEGILPYIKDRRYEKIDNKPLLMIYNPKMFDKNNMRNFLHDLDVLAIKNGFKGFFFMAANVFNFTEALEYGFKGITEFPPHGIKNIIPNPKELISSSAKFEVVSLNKYITDKKYCEEQPYLTFKACFPSWDNTARKAYSQGCVFEVSKEEFSSWLSGILKWTKEHNPSNQQYVYINAWNEWAEGAILEPTTRYGYQNLQIVKECLEKNQQ